MRNDVESHIICLREIVYEVRYFADSISVDIIHGFIEEEGIAAGENADRKRPGKSQNSLLTSRKRLHEPFAFVVMDFDFELNFIAIGAGFKANRIVDDFC